MTSLRNAWNRLPRGVVALGGRRVPRWLRIVLWSLAGLELVYLVAANVFLNFGLLPLAFDSTNQVRATISSGFSLLPGRVHVKNARFIFQDHNVQFSLDMSSAFMVLHLGELTQHTFHASHLRGEGVV